MVFLRLCLILCLGLCCGCDALDRQEQTVKESKSSQQENNLEAKQAGSTQEALKRGVETPNENGFTPFYVFAEKGSRKNHYIPSGFMGDWKCVDFDGNWEEHCQGGEGSCIKIAYDVKCSRDAQKWAGIYWLNPPNNWGNRKGGYNLTGAERLVFWAKGQEGGEQIQEFSFGGIGNNYPDSDSGRIGPIILSTVWREYSIDLKGKDLSYISGGFAWTTSEDVNGESCTFYLDNIRFE